MRGQGVVVGGGVEHTIFEKCKRQARKFVPSLALTGYATGPAEASVVSAVAAVVVVVVVVAVSVVASAAFTSTASESIDPTIFTGDNTT